MIQVKQTATLEPQRKIKSLISVPGAESESAVSSSYFTQNSLNQAD